MKLRYACIAALFALAPVGAQVQGPSSAEPPKACPCGVNCPLGGKCESCPCAQLVKQTTEKAEAPKGHKVTICDGKSCREVWVPEAPRAAGQMSSQMTFALPPPAVFHPKGSPQLAITDDGTATLTKVKFMDRGPVRHAVKEVLHSFRRR